jgi:thiol-disulfide isomerase/thioredoxin
MREGAAATAPESEKERANWRPAGAMTHRAFKATRRNPELYQKLQNPCQRGSFCGKVVLLDFWGVWCQPCVEKLPVVERLARKYRDRGLAVIAVHTKQDAEKIGEFLAKQPLAVPVAVDTGETARRYGVQAFPSYVLIDRAGNVVAAPSNSPPKEAKIEELLRR